MRRALGLVVMAIGCGGAQGVDEPAGDSGTDTAVVADGSSGDVAADGAPVEDSALVVDATDGAPGDAAVDAPLPAAAKSVLVYSLNIENMIFDWKDFVHVMKRDARNVDVFLVQQMTNKKRLDELAAFMTARLGEKYEGIVAQNTPTDTRFQGEVTPRPPVTTGVIWRSARFKYVSHETWFPFGDRDGAGGHTCDTRTNHSGYETIRVRLEDTLAKKQVVAASLRHWTWMDCSLKNMLEMVDGKVGGASAHAPMPNVPLQIVGGDFNGPAFDAAGDYKCWYRVMVAGLGGEACAGHPNLGYADPVYDKCLGDKKCVDANSGIDFIFARGLDGKPVKTSGFDIISYDQGDNADIAETGSDRLSNTVAADGFNDVNSNYSEHRGRRALFFYE